MAWETAIVLGGLGVAGLFLWFATKQSENWHGLLMKVLFTFLGLFALHSAGASTLAVINVANSTSLNLTTSSFNLLEAGSLSSYKIIYYGTRAFIGLFLAYYIYEALMWTGEFIHRRKRRKKFMEGEEPQEYGQ